MKKLIEFRYTLKKGEGSPEVSIVTIIAENDDFAYEILKRRYPNFAKHIKPWQYEVIRKTTL
jgi:hypothetical protein